MGSVLWFRRDLRLGDHPALTAAAEAGEVTGVFVIDPALWQRCGAARRGWVAASVTALRDQCGGALTVRVGDPAGVLPALASEVGAEGVWVTGEPSPFGRRRDARVAAALDERGITGAPVGTPYAVEPGLLRTGGGTGYRVFTPFSRAWREHGFEAPLPAPEVRWAPAASEPDAESLLAEAIAAAPALPEAGEAAALERWRRFLDADLDGYATRRDLPAADATSRLSAHLKVGAIHPRRLLADLAERPGDDAERFATELAWRDFYADVLWHDPPSAWRDWRDLGLDYDDPGGALEAWRTGRTGFPIVDAGMRQLLAEGWMHNRVRMITASFLTKDLHAWWPIGARHFLTHLIDDDIASNNHGWQWVAGTGTDASPYFRVFNPVTQGKRFDPDGDYVRRWVPELAHLPGAAAHEPWKHRLGFEGGYPRPILEHAEERREALARYEARRVS